MEVRKAIPFRQLRDFSVFRFEGRVYTKVYNGLCIDERTGKDAILALGDKVTPIAKAIVCSI
jgi:hypothetical protein